MRSGLGRVAGLMVVVFAAGFVAIAGALAVTWAMGWVTGAQIDDVVAILRSTKTTGTVAEKSEDEGLNTPSEQEAVEAQEKARIAQAELLKTEQLEIERKKMELETVRQDAQHAVTELDAKTKALAEEMKRFEAQKKAYEESGVSEGTRKLRETLAEMDSEKAAQMLYDSDVKATAKVLAGMKKDGRAAILEAIFDMDRKRGLTDATGRAGQIMKLMGDPAPVAIAD